MVKLRGLSLEKWLLFIFFCTCVALPFAMARSPLEIASQAIPIWINFYGGIGFWYAGGKPLWQSFLACYGVSSTGIICIYLGTLGGQFLFIKFKNWLQKNLEKGVTIPFKSLLLILKIEPGYRKFDSFTQSRQKRFTEWLGKESVPLVLFILLIPLPLTDIIATTAMGIKKVRYGLWYLLAANIVNSYLIVFLIYSGIDLFIH